MIESTLTLKGQTTVPQAVREHLHAPAGARLNWHILPDGAVMVRAKTKSILDLAGMLSKTSHAQKASKPVSISQMNAWA